MELMIHTCCSPCLTYTAEYYSHDFDITAFWFNPNIHPFREYEKRLKSLMDYKEKTGLKVIYKDEYPLRRFLEGALRAKNRCEFCYEWRLSETAKVASEEGFDAFTTTLTLSPYQDHELIKKIGGRVGNEKGVKFIYSDLTDGFYRSHEIADDHELYKQSYCGCIFSEMERYKKKIIKEDNSR